TMLKLIPLSIFSAVQVAAFWILFTTGLDAFEGFPKPSDIFMRTLTVHPEGPKDARNTWEAVTNFHVTRLEWVYWQNRPLDKNFIDSMRSRVNSFGGSLNPVMSTAPGLSPWCRTLDGGAATVPWLRVYGNDRTNQCANNPDTMKGFSNAIANQLAIGVNAFQFDDVGMNVDVLHTAGGCYCDFCVSGFEVWLSKNTKLEAYGKKGRGDGAHFDIKAWLVSEGVKSGDPTWNDPRFPADLKKDYEAFQIESVRGFLPRVQDLASRMAGRRLSFSKNTREEWLFDIYNYAMYELNWGEASPRFIWDFISKHRAVGGTVVFDGPKKYPLLEGDVAFQRIAWATCYAAGGYAFVPWDMFTAPAKPRQFVAAKDFGDLTGFVDTVAPFLDSYTNLLPPWLGEETTAVKPAVSIEGRGQVAAFPHKNTKPGESRAVVHLLNWEKSPQSVRVQLDPPQLLGSARRFRVKAWQIGKEAPDIISEGEVRPFDITVKEWTLLEIEALPGGKVPAAPRLFPFGGMTLGETDLRAEAESGASIVYTTDGSEPGPSSAKWSQNLKIAPKEGESAVVKVKAILGGQASPVTEARFTAQNFLRAAPALARSESGVLYDYYEGNFPSFPKWENLTPTLSGKVEFFHQGPRPVSDKAWAGRYRGYLKIPKTGPYKLYGFFSADKGELRVTLGDKVVFDATEALGKSTEARVALEAGIHPITVEVRQTHADGSKGSHYFFLGFSGMDLAPQRITDTFLIREP
ncbi:MAG: chitobiase/beta-hexosaminidase C-terminal domain-containing protein, partial [Spirochaetia bacterium]|nr:chitobiase/beta-hexosaminidase C-terminal domain-containing protein [Spirochaetia bacterium]